MEGADAKPSHPAASFRLDDAEEPVQHRRLGHRQSGWRHVVSHIDLLLANRLFGPVESGRYAAVLQLSAMLSTLGMTVGEIFAPTMYQMYARGDIDGLAVI